MNRRSFLKTMPACAILAARPSTFAQEAAPAPVVAPGIAPIVLPRPEKEGGKSVLAALWERKTIRTISDMKLSPQMLSNLLWAAWGVNRESGPSGRLGRTAASARNAQEIDLYVVLPEGIYLYEAVPHRLAPIVGGDHRDKMGGRAGGGGASVAPVSLVFVADFARLKQGGISEPESQKFCASVATGLIVGNVHLFAASQGLAAWFHSCNKQALIEQLKLRPDQQVQYAQTVGYPA